MLMTVSQESANGDGFTQPYTGQIPSVSYTFTATINPCSMDLTANVQPTLIQYTIGSTSLTSGDYSFTQTPVCNYGEIVELTNLPFYVQHNRATQDFTIPYTENRSLKGTTTVSMRGYVM